MMGAVVIRLGIISSLSPNLEESSATCDPRVRLRTILLLLHCHEQLVSKLQVSRWHVILQALAYCYNQSCVLVYYVRRASLRTEEMILIASRVILILILKVKITS